MRIVYIAAGAAGHYCGACTHDVTLVRALSARGHRVVMLPLYTPLRADGPNPSERRVFYGGLNAWLQQHSRFFRRTPRWFDWFLDRPWLLRFISRFAIESAPEELGDMTVSVLRGADGNQRKELDKLVDYLAETERPELVNLTNSLLVAVAPEIKRRLGVPIVCHLQGEESFVDRLPEPYRQQSLDLMRDHAKAVDVFVASGAAYAGIMSDFLAVPRERVRVIPPGIDLGPYQATGPRPRRPFRVGQLSRLAKEKGVDLLAEAFVLLARKPDGEAVLQLAGDAGNGELLREVRWHLATAGLGDRFEYEGELDLAGKVRFLKSCSAFAQPSREPEEHGVACLEAMAAGVPVVVPDSGIFPEIIEATGGGLLVSPEDALALADALAALRDDPDRADALGRAAAAGAAQHYNSDRMADATIELYGNVMRGR